MHFAIPDRSITGLVVPVGALRGNDDIGVGEFLDLIPLGEFCCATGIKLIQILPVNDSGFQSSPYSSLTAFGLNPLYISLSRIKGAGDFKKEIAELRKKNNHHVRFSYCEVLSEKLAILGKLFNADQKAIISDSVSGQLASWIAQNPWVKEYAVYRELKAKNKGSHWKEWPHYQKPSAADIDSLWNNPESHADQLFWVWIQSLADAQFSEAALALSKMGIALKGDIPILMNEDSCDVWAHPDYFSRELTAGAPPDMFSPLGQNWGFPIYNWKALEADDYSWWRQRLAVANRYYAAYRIDHVLGFFRIWAAPQFDNSAVLGRFIPSISITRKELSDIGFDASRLRWLSKPHIPTAELYAALEAAGLGFDERGKAAAPAFEKLLTRIGSEELWLFREDVRGERDIEAQALHPALSRFLETAWRNRMLIEFEMGQFLPSWSYRDTRAYQTLSEAEKGTFERLIAKKKTDSEEVWEAQGRELLATLTASTPMLACAEDLGAVPECVPHTLEKLGILGLRVLRWACNWEKAGEPYIPLDKYPELSVCTPAVHDSSTVRAWWEGEADQAKVSAFIKEKDLPTRYTPNTAQVLLKATARARSRICVFQIQDLLHLSLKWYSSDPSVERVNVPGTVNDINWTYRLPDSIEAISKDKALIQAIKELTASRQEHS